MARDIATGDVYMTSRRQQKKVEMLFAHLKRILKLDRLRLRGPKGAKDELILAATAQNLRKMANIIPMPRQPVPGLRSRHPLAPTTSRYRPDSMSDFFNTITPKAAAARI
jgi:hypothetical protein